jgi:hypothetical protein
MPNSVKDRIATDLEKAKAEGQLRSERIREIMRNAISQAVGELKAGSSELRLIIRDAIATLLDTSKEKGKELKDDVTASVEGLIEGISHSRREAIAKTEMEIQQLQAQMDTQEEELQSTIDSALTEIETISQDASSDVKSTIQNVVNTVKDSEEVNLLRKRYAQLQAQLAILRANLAARYGERYDEVKRHLDSAKVWYNDAQERARTQAEANEVDSIQKKRAEFEAKIGEAGTALARKEKQIKQILKELWHSVSNP